MFLRNLLLITLLTFPQMIISHHANALFINPNNCYAADKLFYTGNNQYVVRATPPAYYDYCEQKCQYLTKALSCSSCTNTLKVCRAPQTISDSVINLDYILECNNQCRNGQQYAHDFRLDYQPNGNIYNSDYPMCGASVAIPSGFAISSDKFTLTETDVVVISGDVINIALGASVAPYINEVIQCGHVAKVFEPMGYNSFATRSLDVNDGAWGRLLASKNSWYAKNPIPFDTGIDIIDGDQLTITYQGTMYYNNQPYAKGTSFLIRKPLGNENPWASTNMSDYFIIDNSSLNASILDGSAKVPLDDTTVLIALGLQGKSSAVANVRYTPANTTAVTRPDNDRKVILTGTVSGFSNIYSRLGLVHYGANFPGDWQANSGGMSVTVERKGCVSINGANLEYGVGPLTTSCESNTAIGSCVVGTYGIPSAWTSVGDISTGMHKLNITTDGKFYLRIKPLDVDPNTLMPTCAANDAASFAATQAINAATVAASNLTVAQIQLMAANSILRVDLTALGIAQANATSNPSNQTLATAASDAQTKVNTDTNAAKTAQAAFDVATIANANAQAASAAAHSAASNAWTICNSTITNARSYYTKGESSGQYFVTLNKQSLNNIESVISKIVSKPTEVIRLYLFGDLLSAPDKLSYCSESALKIVGPFNVDCGIVPRIFNTFISESGFLKTIRAAMVLYIALTSIYFLVGFAKFTEFEFLLRILKLAVIAALTSPGSWEVFNNNIFQAIIQGGITLIVMIVNSTQLTLGLNVKSAITNFGDVFGFFDLTLSIIFSQVTWFKITSILLSSFFGVFMAVVIVTGFINALTSIVRVSVLYAMNLIMIGLLLMLGPIFITLMLFNVTKPMFDAWVKQLLAYTIQPVVVIAALFILNQLFVFTMHKVLEFTACQTCLLGLYIPFVGVSICILSGYMPLAGMFGAGIFAMPIKLFTSAFFLSMIAMAMESFINFGSQLATLIVTSGGGAIDMNIRRLTDTKGGGSVFKDLVGDNIITNTLSIKSIKQGRKNAHGMLSMIDRGGGARRKNAGGENNGGGKAGGN